jgi:hypothetical protein
MAVSPINPSLRQSESAPGLSAATDAGAERAAAASSYVKAVLLTSVTDNDRERTDPVTGAPKKLGGQSAMATSMGAASARRTGGVHNIGTSRAASIETTKQQDGFSQHARQARRYTVKDA